MVSNMSKFDKLREELSQMAAGANTSCKDFTSKLSEFGFDVKSNKNKGHRSVTHSRLPDWHGSNYNCGHSEGTHVKRNYVKDFLKIVDKFEDELQEILK